VALPPSITGLYEITLKANAMARIFVSGVEINMANNGKIIKVPLNAATSVQVGSLHCSPETLICIRGI
jgi:hypothetical protein